MLYVKTVAFVTEEVADGAADDTRRYNVHDQLALDMDSMGKYIHEQERLVAKMGAFLRQKFPD